MTSSSGYRFYALTIVPASPEKTERTPFDALYEPNLNNEFRFVKAQRVSLLVCFDHSAVFDSAFLRLPKIQVCLECRPKRDSPGAGTPRARLLDNSIAETDWSLGFLLRSIKIGCRFHGRDGRLTITMSASWRRFAKQFGA